MTKTLWMLGLLGVVAAGAFACSGSTAGAGGGPSACLQNAAGSSCYACVQNNCGSALSTFENACSPFVNCMCSGGSYNGCNEQACASQISQACGSATTGLTSCSACNSQCAGFSLSSCSGGSSSGGFSSGSGGGSGGSAASCVQQGLAAAGTTCASCIESHCSAQLGALENSCGNYLACICPGGVFNACSEQACTGQITSTCTSASSAIGTCETQSCTTECTPASSSGSGGTTCSSSSSGSGSSSGGGPLCSTATCGSAGMMLSFCDVGGNASCYYQVGGQTFPCNSCSDTASCAQAAAAACP